LLGGMMEFPSSIWREEKPRAHDEAPARANWRRQPGEIRHVFTHFELHLTAYKARLEDASPMPAPVSGHWIAPSELAGQALPSVMRKMLKLCRTTTG
jgi:A/G-specific adenine glycosylase